MHVRPPVVLFDQVNSFGNSGVSGSERVVKKVCYPPPKTVVFHDNKSLIFIEVVVCTEGKSVGGHPGNKGIIMGGLGNFYSIIEVIFYNYVVLFS
jgi:hypothetical protein